LAFKHESLGGADAPLKWLGFSARDDGVEVQNASRVSHQNYCIWLVVWYMFYFFIYWESSSQLTFIFFRGVGQPPTSYPKQEKHVKITEG